MGTYRTLLLQVVEHVAAKRGVGYECDVDDCGKNAKCRPNKGDHDHHRELLMN